MAGIAPIPRSCDSSKALHHHPTVDSTSSLIDPTHRFPLPQVDSVYDELRRVADMCEPAGLARFGDLRETAVDVVQALLRRAYAPTVEQVDRLVEFELAHVNTLHPDFIGERLPRCGATFPISLACRWRRCD